MDLPGARTHAYDVLSNASFCVEAVPRHLWSVPTDCRRIAKRIELDGRCGGDRCTRCSPPVEHEPTSLDELLEQADAVSFDTASLDEAAGEPAQRVRGASKKRRSGKSHAAAKRMRDAARTAHSGTDDM